MQHIVHEVEYPLPLETCLHSMADPGLHSHLKSRLGSRLHRKVTRFEKTPTHLSWDVEVRVLDEIPSFLKSIIRPDQLSWTQTLELDLEKFEMGFQVRHQFPPQMLRVQGVGRFVDTGQGSTRFRMDLEVESRLPVIGRQLERFLEEHLARFLQEDTRLRVEYMRQHPTPPVQSLQDVPARPA